MVCMRFWQKVASVLCLAFMATTGFAATCDVECTFFNARPDHHASFKQAATSEASASVGNHHSGHHSENPRFSPPSTASLLTASGRCEDLGQIGSVLKPVPDRSRVSLLPAVRGFSEPALDATVTPILLTESPPLLSNAPLQTSLRI